MNLFLVGYRCTGKTTVGKILAEKLGWRFVDADAELERYEGIPISEMVERFGWPYFRKKERETLRRICRKDRQTVATGGGAVLDPENVMDMKASGRIIWLKASPETVAGRMMEDPKTESQRPALTDKGVREEIAETLAQRTPLYQSASDVSVDTDHLKISDICGRILTKTTGTPRPTSFR